MVTTPSLNKLSCYHQTEYAVGFRIPFCLIQLFDQRHKVEAVGLTGRSIFVQIQQTKLQNNQTEEERLSAAHARIRSAFERTIQKPSRRQRSTDDSNSSVNDSQQQLSALIASQEQEVRFFLLKYYCAYKLMRYALVRASS